MSQPAFWKVLQEIETIAGDDFCEELAMCEASGGRYRLRGRIKEAYAKLSKIYRLAHGFNPKNSCYHVHGNWRKEFGTASPSGQEKRNGAT